MIGGLRAAAEVGLRVPAPAQYYAFLACAAILLVALVPFDFMVTRRLAGQPAAQNLKALRWYLRSAIAYLAVNSLEVLAPTVESTLFFMQLCYLFIVSIPLRLFFFSLSVTGRSSWIPRSPALVWSLPAVAFVLALTNRYHHLNWRELAWFASGPFVLVRAVSYGPWFWLIWSTMEIAVLVGCGLTLASVVAHGRNPSRHSALILVGTLVPVAANAVYVLRLIAGWQKDFSAVAFGAAGILFAVGVLRGRLFDLVPIARRKLVDALADPLVVVDRAGAVVDANPAARAAFGIVPGHARADADPFLATLEGLRAADAAFAAGGTAELSPDGERWYEVRTAEIRPRSRRTFRLYAMRDITERRRLMDEKDSLAERLTRALAEVKTMQGIVPICASCKKVRDDQGFWQQVENFVASRTMAEFSLGLCPDCRERLYPDHETG